MTDVLAHVLGAVALALILLLGFSAQRAGACTVNAMAEVMTTGRAYLLASFVKAALWAAAIFGVVTLLSPTPARGFEIVAPEAVSLAGAFVFGVGAAINGGCAMSTLQRLADGDVWWALTLLGLGVGFVLWSLLAPVLPLMPTRELPVAWAAMGPWASVLLVLLAVLGALEAWHLWRTRGPGRSMFALLASPRYRLSTAAMLIGICGGLLYALKGAWSYTNWIRTTIDAIRLHAAAPALFGVLLFVALVAGMVLASVLRRSFRLRSAPRSVRLRRFSGGIVMGLGAGAIPGGNDALLLTGLPTLSLWAIGVYVSLLAGVAVTMLALRALGATIGRVDCTGDVCREDE